MQFLNSFSTINWHKKKSINAFTLIELLGVMTAILALVAITFGVSRGVLNQQARTQAKAELAIIAQALEEFKQTYGDYPWVSEEDDPTTGYANARRLTLALAGFAVFEYDEEGAVSLEKITSGEGRKSFIDPERLNFNRDFGNPSSADDLTDVFFVDPWRRPYVFVYNKGTISWDNIAYVLFSKGPDGKANLGSIVSTGIIVPNNSEDNEDNDNIDIDIDIDNIYPGE